jgi:hypothetical protein
MRREFVLTLAFFVVVERVFGIAPQGRATCPDIVVCKIKYGYGPVEGYETFQWVGSIKQGSCYSWAHAKCRP